ncbi:MAG: hypothetical protein M3P39_05380 [Actinomycetota bacterium]|nr:hypothetical protein [Actinomycetota bacterium]
MSFDSVLTEQSDPLTRRILRIVGDRGTAEDLRQETLVRAWRAAPREAEPERLRAWLHRVQWHPERAPQQRGAERLVDALLAEAA